MPDYLDGLTAQLHAEPQYIPALIAFDVKPLPNTPQPYLYNLKSHYFVIRKHFSSLPQFKNVSILTTIPYSASIDFLAIVSGYQLSNEAVDIDESERPNDIATSFASHKLKGTYANGSSVAHDPNVEPLLSKLGNVRDAITLRNPAGFRLVYGWTIDKPEVMKTYLDLPGQIDGVITGDPATLKQLILSDEYKTLYRPATQEDTPFA